MALLEEQVTLDVRVISLIPMFGVKITYINKNLKKDSLPNLYYFKHVKNLKKYFLIFFLV